MVQIYDKFCDFLNNLQKNTLHTLNTRETQLVLVTRMLTIRQSIELRYGHLAEGKGRNSSFTKVHRIPSGNLPLHYYPFSQT